MSLFAELKRRNVFRVATAYVVVGWLLTEIATTLLPTFGAPEWVAKVIIFVFALGFVPVLLFAWAFELTPDGIKLEKDVDRDQSITSETGKKLNYVTIAAVLVGVGFLVLTRSGMNPVAPQSEEVIATEGAPSVAVLPFVNMSGNAENEYFSDGLTETLLHMLAQIPELKVAARTSSFAFKNKQDDIRGIADALDVAHVLEGSVQRAGDRVRITAQLIRADDGFHVWSENYDRTLDDIFAIQDEIASHVGEALSASLLGTKEPAPIVGVGTENLEAYDNFLRATAERLKGSYGSLKSAEGLLKDALALDPGFLDAKTLLAFVLTDQWQTGLADESAGLDTSIRLLEQVLAVRPDDARATGMLYRAEIWRDVRANNMAAAKDTTLLLQELARAHPADSDIVIWAGTMVGRFGGDREEGLRLIESIVEFDPLNAQVYYELAVANVLNRRYEEARAAASRSLELEPQQPNAHTMIARSYREEGRIVEWLRSYLEAMEIDPKDHELPGEIAEVLYALDLPDEADRFRERVLAIAPSSPAAYAVEVLHHRARGNLEEARAAARKAIADDIDNRQNAYLIAIRFLSTDAMASGTVAETLAYLETEIPSLADFDTPAEVAKEQWARFFVMPLWYATLPEEEWSRRYLAMFDHWRLFGFDAEQDSLGAVGDRLAKGDLESAIEIAVRVLSNDPVGKNLNWEEVLSLPHFSRVADDPRVQAGMARYTKDEAALRDSVLAFLQSRDQGSSR